MSQPTTSQTSAFESRDWQALRRGWPVIALTAIVAGVLAWAYPRRSTLVSQGALAP